MLWSSWCGLGLLLFWWHRAAALCVRDSADLGAKVPYAKTRFIIYQGYATESLVLGAWFRVYVRVCELFVCHGVSPVVSCCRRAFFRIAWPTRTPPLTMAGEKS